MVHSSDVRKMIENHYNQTKLYSKNSVYHDRKGWSLLMAHEDSLRKRRG